MQMVIQQNLDRELPLEELARESYFSEYHFHRIFRAVVGEPLMEYIRRLRLERAASHLKHTRNSITHIAFDAGYQTHEAFTRAFKAAFGCSPSSFRSSNGATVLYRSDSDNKELHSDEGDIAVQTIGGGEYAVTTHFGPYDKLGETYHRLFGQWLLQSDRELRSEPCIEFYLNDPESTEPEDLLTDICVPLQPK